MTAQGTAALQWAIRSAFGLNYQWGGTGDPSYDCSGLTQAAWAKGAGVKLPRTSQEQRTAGTVIPLSAAQPGDLVTFSYPGESGNPAPANHVALYVNPTTVFAASHSGVPIGYAPLDAAHLDRVIRPGGAGAVGAAAGIGPADVQTVSVNSEPAAQLAGYQSVVNLTPWGLPLNPLKLPGYLGGKLGSLSGEAGGGILSGVMTGLVDAIGPVLLTLTLAAAGLGLIGMGIWRATQPERDAVNEKVSQAASLAAVAV